jgi:MinD-like ATPase involved in chromosome partitioning or flagellar assembly
VSAADEVVVVTTPEMPAFSDAYAMNKLLNARVPARRTWW